MYPKAQLSIVFLIQLSYVEKNKRFIDVSPTEPSSFLPEQ